MLIEVKTHHNTSLSKIIESMGYKETNVFYYGNYGNINDIKPVIHSAYIPRLLNGNVAESGKTCFTVGGIKFLQKKLPMFTFVEKVHLPEHVNREEMLIMISAMIGVKNLKVWDTANTRLQPLKI